MEGIHNANGEKRTIASFHPDDFKGGYSERKPLRRIVRTDGCSVEYIHEPYDPPGINRVNITAEGLHVELLPSKGMSIGTVLHGKSMLLWRSLLDILPDPDHVDLTGELIRNGEPLRGFKFIEYLVGGVMMFGLGTWGMPYEDGKTGKSATLHGEVSNIPVERVSVRAGKESLELSGEFFVHDGKGDTNETWYRRGERLYRVRKRVVLHKRRLIVAVSDTISNVSGKRRDPDWGYSLKFHPYNGTEYLVPSRNISLRSGGTPGPAHERWRPAGEESVREERGIIHRGLLVKKSLLNGNGVETLVRHRNGEGLRVVVPESPYFLSWFSSGGKGSREFVLPGDTGAGSMKVFEKSWNGIGPEFGISALDHDGNVDPCIVRTSLEPGESFNVDFFFQPVSSNEMRNLEKEIRFFNKTRKTGGSGRAIKE